MFQQYTYYLIFGIPFIVYLGILVLVLFVVTAVLALLKRKGMIKMNVRWHFRLAYLSLILGFLHGVLGVLAYF
jgi:dolichyl-phosphate-mannose--protein O-mannosyl transferase